MTRIEHERAHELMMDIRIDEISATDQQWLDLHLSDCAECSRLSASLDHAVRAVRLPDVMASSSLVRATQRRVRARAVEMNSQAAAMRPLWIAVALVCATAAVTMPLVWSAFAWLGTTFSLTRIEWSAGFAFAGLAPSLAASFLLIASGINRTKFRAVPVRCREAA